METIPLKECTQIGFLRKTHGIHGELYLVFEEDYREPFASARILFVKIDGLLVPFFVERDQLQIKSSTQALVKFRWIDSEEKASEFTGLEVYLKNEDLTNNQDPTQEQLIGFQVVNANKITVGTITHVVNYSGNIVLTVKNRGKEILIPYNEDLVEDTDPVGKTIQMILPNGLLAEE